MSEGDPTQDFSVSQEVDLNLLHHARLGLKRIHQRCGTGSTTTTTVAKPLVNEIKNDETPAPKKSASVSTKSSSPKAKKDKKSPNKAEKEEEKKYLSLKKPVERSIYYQHSKQGMKYWYEEKKPQSYSSKVPLGRKGMMLGLVDAPLK